MVTPNADCSLFCAWCTSNSLIRWSTARLNLIAIVKNAADTSTEVTNQQWKDFIQITQIYYPVYLQSEALSG
jgi:hypothetical protein